MASNNSIFPKPDVLNDLEYGKYVLTNLAAKRARQIKDGAPPLVRIDSNHPLSIALAEIAEGKIKPLMGPQETAIEDAEDLAALQDFGDDGLLLPSLEEIEAEAGDLGLGDLGGLDFEGEAAEEEKEAAAEEDPSISALLGEEDETEEAPKESNEISLDDLVSQEESGAEEGSEDAV
jgi:DNA-directed RNA polymerase subunit omega